MSTESNDINHKKRAGNAWPILVNCAKRKETISYGDLSEQIDVHHRASKFLLAEIQSYCAKNKLPPLTILVVDRHGQVGAGFTEWITGSFETDKEIVFDYNWDREQNPFREGNAPLIKPLKVFEKYSRKQAHEIFAPDTNFTPQAGTWGLQGIVPIPDRDGDFVFFVTYGKDQSEHVFDESITTEGVLTWQSQPKQSFTDAQIQKFIGHDNSKNSIYLFLRTSKKNDYTYLGQLKYLSHDSERQTPVHFQWQILDWDPSDQELKSMGLELINLQNDMQLTKLIDIKEDCLVIENLPASSNSLGKAQDTKSFKGRKPPDYASIQRENKKLGMAGELLVIIEERRNLLENGRADLASKIIHVSEVEGDGAGYDVLSYEIDGTKKYIEVKTTKGSAQTDFYITPNELAFSKAHASQYYLYRLYEFDLEHNFAKLGIFKGNLLEQLELIPQSFRARKL